MKTSNSLTDSRRARGFARGALLACALLVSTLAGASRITELGLDGRIAQQNISFDMRAQFTEMERDGRLELLAGPIAILSAELPRGYELERDGERFHLVRDGRRWGVRAQGELRLRFAVRVKPEKEWMSAEFRLPVAPVRRASISANRPNLDIELLNAANTETVLDPQGCPTTTANLALSPTFAARWKPEIRRMDSELVATCDIHTIASANPGTLRVDSVFDYQIAQGQLNELVFDIPEINIISVTGDDIQDWRVERDEPRDAALLKVQLTRASRSVYRLNVVGERPLSAFPTEAELPVLIPRGMVRSGGHLLLGTDSAVKVQLAGTSGLTQIDAAAFPKTAASERYSQHTAPRRGIFAWQYAALPYALKLAADDIAVAIHADMNLLATVANEAVSVDARLQVEFRDAPARELRLRIPEDPRWTVVSVSGQRFSESDVDTRTLDGEREIIIPFREPAEGVTTLHLRLEAQLGSLQKSGFALPFVNVVEARSQRGYVVVSGERGVRLTPAEVGNMNDIHPASAPIRADGLQLAYRFREAGWRLALAVEYARSAIHTEVFHLASIGEGVLYMSAAVNGHVSGAPVQSLRFRVPPEVQGLDITGVGLDGWSRDGDVCTVRLANRILGDFTLLLSYDHPIPYDLADLTVGQIETLGAASELGFIAIATSAPLSIDEVGALPPALIRVPRDELPAGYAATVTAPVVAAWKYARAPHILKLRATALDSRRPIEQVVDFLSLRSEVGRNGEAVTYATWQVKNAARQFLEITLPPQSTVWSVRQGRDSAMRDTPSQQSDERLLVPLERPRDPNDAISVEVVYAQPSSKVWRMGGKVSLIAPRLPSAPVTFTAWHVEASDRRAFAKARCGAITFEGGGGRSTSGKILNLHRTATLPDEPPLTVSLLMVPAFLGAADLVMLAVGLAIGLAALLLALLRRSRLMLAAGLSGLSFGALQVPAARVFAGPALAVLVSVALLVSAIRALRFVIARIAARIERNRMPPPPLGTATPTTGNHEPPPPAPPTSPQPAPSATVSALGLLLAASLLTLAAGARADEIEAGATPPTRLPLLELRSLDVEVDAPLPTPRDEPNALVRWTMEFDTLEKHQRFELLPIQSVIVESDADDEIYRLEPGAESLTLVVRDKGSHSFKIVTREALRTSDGKTALPLRWLPNIRNRLIMRLPSNDLDVRSELAAWIDSTVEDGSTRVEMAFMPASSITVSWSPRARDTRSETPLVYADILCLAQLRPGVVDTVAQAVFNVVQGEERVFALRLPEGTTATEVASPGMATWRFDPATRRLEAVMRQPRTGQVPLTLKLQTPYPPPPSELALTAPSAENVARQRGRIGVAGPETMLLRFGQSEEAVPIDAADLVASTAGAPALAEALKQSQAPVRRAFRFDTPAALRIPLSIEEVQPDLIVSESASFSLGDERCMLSTVLDVTIAKAGVFGLQLTIPEDYEVESLTGADISHWDDLRATGRGVEIWFTRRVLGSTPVNLLLTTPQRGVAPELDVPHVSVAGARRHTGRLAVIAERGIRLTVASQTAVAMRREEARDNSALVFDLLRPDWRVRLSTEVLPPVLKPELLHRVELSEGMLQHRLHLHYRIGDAGVRFFYLRLPHEDATLTVSGRRIARVRPLNEGEQPAHLPASGGSAAAAGTAGEGRVWEIELNGKVENAYEFTAQFQEPYDPAAGSIVVRPVTLLGAARQSGWLAVNSAGRIEVAPRGEPVGLKPEDARALPVMFGAGDLSSAILCYRALREDYSLPLEVVRHAAARVLPATVRSVELVSVLSDGGRLLGQATIALEAGHMRFLRVALPSPRATLWSALVNGAEVSVAYAGGALNIPLETATIGQQAEVTLVYADELPSGKLLGHQTLQAPSFPDLPLRGIQWKLFVPAYYKYKFSHGTFDLSRTTQSLRTFGKYDYDSFNKAAREASTGTARRNLDNLDDLLQKGRQSEARKVLQQAVTLSQGEESLNEDARVQFRNVVRQQVKMGLINRRGALRVDNNIFEDGAPAAPHVGWNDGNFDASYARQVEERLEASDKDGLEQVAQKLVEVQAGAEATVAAIQVAMPRHGREFSFRRALQNELGGKLTLELNVKAAGGVWELSRSLWPLAALLLGFAVFLRLVLGSQRHAK